MGLEHSDRGVGLGGKDVDERVGVAVEGDGRGRFKEFAIKRRKNPDNIV